MARALPFPRYLKNWLISSGNPRSKPSLRFRRSSPCLSPLANVPSNPSIPPIPRLDFNHFDCACRPSPPPLFRLADPTSDSIQEATALCIHPGRRARLSSVLFSVEPAETRRLFHGETFPVPSFFNAPGLISQTPPCDYQPFSSHVAVLSRHHPNKDCLEFHEPRLKRRAYVPGA